MGEACEGGGERGGYKFVRKIALLSRPSRTLVLIAFQMRREY